MGRDGRVSLCEQFGKAARVVGVVVGENNEPDVCEFVAETSHMHPEGVDRALGSDVDQDEAAFALDKRRRHREFVAAVVDRERKRMQSGSVVVL